MAAFMETVSSDLCCSICLDLYTDPVMLDCSHSFCRACISQIMWKTKGNLSCPHCRQVFFHTSLKPNLALANIVESFKGSDWKAETSEQSRKRQKLEEKDEFYCEKHEEKLKLFCEEDQEMVCLVCAMSESHKSHNLLPIKEAFQIYKEKTSYLKKQMREDFSKLHKFINKEEGDFKNKLERKEMEVLKQLEENGVKTAQQISRVEQSISEIQKRLNSQRQELLKDIKAALTGSEDPCAVE
ncbi:E3 ubiquitin-protein ligase TRIM52-like [Latimeria chalumnae]|uniref:E3 ubiquitin-protein ligase TRIM52-like n=1 Tax=Latimeria chalumnae TaxID=7897 RepID=UPI00313D7ABC